MSDAGEMWGEYRKDQRERRAKRVPERTARLRRMLPPGFTVDERNDGYCLIIAGPGVRFSYYPTHGRVQVQGEWKTMSPAAVAALCRKGVGL